MPEIQICNECGLPIVECNAITIGRAAAEQYMRERGYGGLQAREAGQRLIPERRSSGEVKEGQMLARATNALIAELQRQADISGCTTETDGRSVQVDGSFKAEPLVRAVLTAIREPSEAMGFTANEEVMGVKAVWCRLFHWRSLVFVERPRGDLWSWQDRLKCKRCGTLHWIAQAHAEKESRDDR